MEHNPLGHNSKPTTPFPTAEYVGRIKRLIRRVARDDLDALIVDTDINRTYLTGFRSSRG